MDDIVIRWEKMADERFLTNELRCSVHNSVNDKYFTLKLKSLIVVKSNSDH